MARYGFHPPPPPPPPQAPNERRWHPPSHHASVSSNIQNNEIETVMFPVTCHHFPSVPTNGIFLGENPLRCTFSFILFEFFLVVVITRLIHFLLKPLKQPRIISELIGGIVVGPSVLRRNEWFTKNILPENADFVASNIGVMGFMFFLFVYGVKMDMSLVKKTGKKHICTALISMIIPTISSFSVAMSMRKNMDKELAKISSIGGIASYMGLTSCPILYSILRENNLLSSEVGRTALSTALIGDIFGVGVITVFEAAKQGESGAMHALYYVISLVVLVALFVTIINKAMVWIIQKTPENRAVNSSYVIIILLGVLVAGFVTDMCGMAIANGSLWLGLAIPAGPPLATAIVEKSETIMMEIFMPFAFIMVGYHTDVYAMSAVGWSYLAPLFAIVLTGYLTKFLSSWITTIYWRMPSRDGLTLSLILSLRGQIELILFVHWMDKKMVKPPGFTLLVLMTIALTATFTPLICILYDPAKPYMVNKRRTIQHTPPNTDLVVVLSILDRESINSLIPLLELSPPNLTNSISIFALHLIELVGRTSPLFIDHDKQEVPPKYTCTYTINALNLFQELRGTDFVKLRFFTAVTTKRTMYQDICELALGKKAALIILPFHKGPMIHNLDGTTVMGDGARTVTSHVLTNAPCSVGILVDKSENLGNPIIGQNNNSLFLRSRNKLAMLFLGGADSREALVYADRMVANNEEVSLTVVRFLPFNFEGDSEMEKKLDDGTVTWFWVKNERNQRVEYREVVVESGEGTATAIHRMNDGSYDLWIVGRGQGMNPLLLSGLSNWSENEDLGPIGDYVASVDFSGSASVLVIQQQILRG